MSAEGPSGLPVVDRLLDALRRQVALDAAYLTEYRPDGTRVRRIAGDGRRLGLQDGMVVAADESVCLAAVSGRLPSVIGDTRTHRVARRLAWDQPAPIGAFAAAPVRLPDGSLFGALCVAHADPHELAPTLSRFLGAMADVIGEALADDHAAETASRRERRAILDLFEDGRMATVLQPIVDVQDGTTLGVEALTRFRTRPPLPPNVWFAAAARQGLGHELEAAAIARATRLLPTLPSSWYLAVNASPGLALSGVLDELLFEAIAPRMVVEVTEHAAVEDYATLATSLQSLRERGVRVAVDDAGAGFASLRHVVELRPDVVKIDGSLVRGIDGHALQRAMVETFVDFGRTAGATVVAEAVETPAELAVVRDLGVPAAQGYLFASPGTPEDLREQYPVSVPDAFRPGTHPAS